MSLIDKITQIINGTAKRAEEPNPKPAADSKFSITHDMMKHHRELDEDYDEMLAAERKIKKIKDQIKAKQAELHAEFMKAVNNDLPVEPGPYGLEKDTKKHRFSPPYKQWLEDAIGASSIEAKTKAYKEEKGIPEEDEFVRVVKIRKPVESRVD